MSEHIDQLRAEYPNASPVLLDTLAEFRQVRAELRELGGTIADLVGRYGYRADQTGNADLAALVGELRQAVGLPVNDDDESHNSR